MSMMIVRMVVVVMELNLIRSFLLMLIVLLFWGRKVVGLWVVVLVGEVFLDMGVFVLGFLLFFFVLVVEMERFMWL